MDDEHLDSKELSFTPINKQADKQKLSTLGLVIIVLVIIQLLILFLFYLIALSTDIFKGLGGFLVIFFFIPVLTLSGVVITLGIIGLSKKELSLWPKVGFGLNLIFQLALMISYMLSANSSN